MIPIRQRSSLSAISADHRMPGSMSSADIQARTAGMIFLSQSRSAVATALLRSPDQLMKTFGSSAEEGAGFGNFARLFLFAMESTSVRAPPPMAASLFDVVYDAQAVATRNVEFRIN